MLVFKRRTQISSLVKVVIHLYLFFLLSESFTTKFNINQPIQRTSFVKNYEKISLSAVSIEQEIKENQVTTSKNYPNKYNKTDIVIIAGFESFNQEVFQSAIKSLPISFSKTNIKIFSNKDIQSNTQNLEKALKTSQLALCSLVFDYDDVLILQKLLEKYTNLKYRFIFESSTELMTFNQVGSFSMASSDSASDSSEKSTSNSGRNGPPPIVKSILSKFSSGKEEDKLQGYLELLKIAPKVLKYIPGQKANDVRTWLEIYGYWNQGGITNIASMFQYMIKLLQATDKDINIPELKITPDVGILHPLLSTYYTSPKEFLQWRLSSACQQTASKQHFKLACDDSPKVAILLYRKHVISNLTYITQLITLLESHDIIPIPIFINGVEAHTIVRDLLTSSTEISKISSRLIKRDETYQPYSAISIDAIINTIGFPLVGGPAGSMEAGRNVDVAQELLTNINLPYIVAAPLLLQSIDSWSQNGLQGLQSVVLYSLPELDGAIDTVVLGGLVEDKEKKDEIVLVEERVEKLAKRTKAWVSLCEKKAEEKKISIVLYGFPPNVGAVGTAALLNVPKSLHELLARLNSEGYNVGDYISDKHTNGESIVAALNIMMEDAVVAKGIQGMQNILENRIQRAQNGDTTIATTLSLPNGGLGSAKVIGKDMTRVDISSYLSKDMSNKLEQCWCFSDKSSPGLSSKGLSVVSGLQFGNVFITVQPLLGIEGDPMRLLFEKDLTPHPQYIASYQYLQMNSDAVIHLGMHGTVEWLPGPSLGNDESSWSDTLLGHLPNLYVYAANNPSESILAKRRGYGTLVSYNVPPYGKSGLYLELSNLKELIGDYKLLEKEVEEKQIMMESIWSTCQKSEIGNDVPLHSSNGKVVDIMKTSIDVVSKEDFDKWVQQLSNYLNELQNRLFSSGLHVLGSKPTNEELQSYLMAYFGPDTFTEKECNELITKYQHEMRQLELQIPIETWFRKNILSQFNNKDKKAHNNPQQEEAIEIVKLLDQTTDEITNIIKGLDGGYIPPAPGGDLLRDGKQVLPTGRNIHALDPYRMPSPTAWIRGQSVARELIRQHRDKNNGNFPETIAVTLWGLDAIKTRGESVAIVLALVGAYPVKEGTGRIVRFDLLPLIKLKRPRIDILASLSGIFRDSFANVVDLLDDLFERAAIAEDEPPEMNYIKKHAMELSSQGVKKPAARLFSNPPGDFGSMVNEVVGTGEWEDSSSLGETWKNRNVYSYGRKDGGEARPEVLNKLLSTTERIVQEIDSVEYGLTDIQEYYANTGALKKAAENRKSNNDSVDLSIVEAFTGGGANADRSSTGVTFEFNASDNDNALPSIAVRDVDDVLRLEYRSKLLNPKWIDAMMNQGSGGAFEVSQRMTAMVGWAATASVDNFVFDQAAERYALDDEIADKLRSLNPEAFKNVVRRLLEAAGRGMWETDDDTLDKLRELYSEADDLVEQVSI